eukprot:8448722-Lingulodinium_polyedra.AAC.1
MGIGPDAREGLRAWAYPPTESGHTVGNYCWYCWRLHGGRYKARGMSLTSLATHIGSSQEAFNKFRCALTTLIDFVLKAGTRDVRLPWQDFEEKTLTATDAREVRFEQPDD